MAKKSEFPYAVRNPVSLSTGLSGHLLAVAPTFMGVKVVERFLTIDDQLGVRHRVLPDWLLTKFPRADENTLQSLIAGLKESALEHGATHEAVELLGLVTPLTKKELSTMAEKLTKKGAAKPAAKKAPAAKGGGNKGNPEALKKAREAADGKRAAAHAKSIKLLVKPADSGLRGGRLAKLQAVADQKPKTVGDIVGKSVKDETGKEHTIDMGALNGMAKRGHISIG